MIAEQSNLKLREALGQYHSQLTALFMQQPEVLVQMPDHFELVPLPVRDPEVTQYALSLAAHHREAPVVYASINAESVTFLLSDGPLEVALPKLEER
jgi:hypothetical protein